MLTAPELILAMSAALAQVDASASTSEPASTAVHEARVTNVSDDGLLISFDLMGDGRVSPGDPFWICRQAGVIASGHVFMTAPGSAVGRAEHADSAPATGQPAVIISLSSLGTMREQIPRPATIYGKVQTLPPGRRTAWINIGSRSGLREADTLLVRRDGIPLARGSVSVLDTSSALIAIRPLVSNALPEPGDGVELWPAPWASRDRRVNSAILDVRQSDEGPILTIAGGNGEGLTEGRLVDLYREGELIGVASMQRVSDPLSEARLIEPATRVKPRLGDVAVVRAAAGDRLPLCVPVFRVDEEHCLIAAGEVDGLQVGERLAVRRPDAADPGKTQRIAELVVTAVKIDYSDARIHRERTALPEVRLWDLAERIEPVWPRPQVVGLVRAIDPVNATFVASLQPGAEPAAGTVVVFRQARDAATGAAVMLQGGDRQGLFYVPEGWGAVDSAREARIEVGPPAK